MKPYPVSNIPFFTLVCLDHWKTCKNPVRSGDIRDLFYASRKSKKDECLDHDFLLLAFAFYYKSNKGGTYLFILYYLFIDPRALSSLDETASDTSDSQILDKEDNSQTESEGNSFL